MKNDRYVYYKDVKPQDMGVLLDIFNPYRQDFVND